jgi:acyl-CoA hydrolase
VQADDVTALAREVLRPQQRIVTAMAAAEPRLFFSHLHQWLKDDKSLKDLTIYCANPNHSYDVLTDRTLADSVKFIAMFLTSAVRNHQSKMVSYLPHNLSAWNKAIHTRGPIDVFWGSCTPPQANGYVSLGPSCVYESDVLRKAKMVVLEVNPNLPYVHGSTVMPIDRADVVIEGSSHELLTLPDSSFDSIDMQIATRVAE